MSADDVLGWALLAEAVVLVVALAVLLGHVACRAVTDGRRGRRLTRARAAFARALADGAPAEAVRDALRGLPARDVLGLLGAYAPAVAGGGRAALTRIAEEVGLVRRAERAATSRRWPRRLRAVQILSTVGGGTRTVPALLDDPRPEVRAQAAGWAAGRPDPELSVRLVARLDDPALVSRFSVQDALLRAGGDAVPALSAALEAAEGPSAARLLAVCARSEAAFVPAARRLLSDPHPPTRALAAEVVGRTAGTDGLDELVPLLADDDAGVRASAATALGLAHHWPAGPRLRALLRDPEWDVRRAAALALRRLGPPGALLLRRALTDTDPAARDMARLVLEVQEDETW